MIKFQFFEKSSSLNCHFKNLGTFVVSISHYMRAYFNYKALEDGSNFELPGDVGFLNVSQKERKPRKGTQDLLVSLSSSLSYLADIYALYMSVCYA